MRRIYLSELTCILFLGCSTPMSSFDPMVMRVSQLVEMTLDAKTEQQAFKDLEALGDEAVPYIVHHLVDMRPLPIRSISLVNKASNAFEGIRHYGPKVVHEALTAILGQITGQYFVDVTNGAILQERQNNLQQWRDWCVKNYPMKSAHCM
jgi:hypothetical protein